MSLATCWRRLPAVQLLTLTLTLTVLLLCLLGGTTEAREKQYELFVQVDEPDSPRSAWGVFEPDVDAKLAMRYIDSLGGLEKRHSCYEASYKQERIQFCYFAVIVAGVPKCGTSAMYKWLTMDCLDEQASPVVFHGAVKKEECFRGTTLEEAWSFLKGLQVETEGALLRLQRTGKQPIMTSGCVINQCNMKMSDILRVPERTKYVVMTRDYADLMWSAYNFWCTAAYDIRCPSTHWVNAYHNYRSPGMFHELAVAKSRPHKTVLSPIDHFGFSNLTNNNFFRSFVTTMWRHNVSHEAILVVASESLAAETDKMVNKMVAFIGLDAQHVVQQNVSKLAHERTNTNNHKGTGTVDATFTPGLYRASGFKPMLAGTRALLHKSWWHDCLWLSNYTGFQYPACNSTSLAAAALQAAAEVEAVAAAKKDWKLYQQYLNSTDISDGSDSGDGGNGTAEPKREEALA